MATEERLTVDDLRFVIRAVHSVCASWNGIGLYLLVRGRDEIKKRFPNDPLKCLIGVLTNWLQLQYNKEKDPELPSWMKLATAVGDKVGGANPRKGKYIKDYYKELWRFNPGEAATKADASIIVSESDDDDTIEVLVAEMSSLLDRVVARWYEIGVLLGVHVGELNMIQSNGALSQRDRLSEMLKVWLSGSGDGVERSWCVLVDAVEHQAGGNNPAEAMKIAEKHPGIPMGTQQATHQVPQAREVPIVHQPRPNGGVAGTSPSTTTKPDSHSIFGERPITRQLDLIKYSDDKGAVQRIRVLDAIAVHWLKVGRHLKISENHLRIFRERENNDPTKCASAVVNKWLESGQDPTWAKLIEALEDSGLTNPAEDLKVALPRMKND